jgi:hypothetical protein
MRGDAWKRLRNDPFIAIDVRVAQDSAWEDDTAT